MKKDTRKARRKTLEKDLRAHLKSEGYLHSYYDDLINDYIMFWEIKENLKIDIEKNGAMETLKNGSGMYRRRSDAVVEIQKISKRMTDILEVIDIG